MKGPVRIANCSGFYGDRLSAAREMVEGGPIDVLTGDWLAELTMLILARTQAKRAGGGYARSFIAQMEQVMGACMDRGIKVVSNAGGLDPPGCAEAVSEVADRLGLSPIVAYVDGDNLLPRLEELTAVGIDPEAEPQGAAGARAARSEAASTGDTPRRAGADRRPLLAHLDTGEPVGDISRFVSANAYLGCWGVVEALQRGADIVVTGRTTDAAVVCGPAAWHHGWARDDWDALAGAVVAGHVIECGTQATGGNYSFFTEVPGMTRVGFPWAEIAADGSSVIGKHDGTGGEVSIGTVTSQLLYEIAGPAYLGPDVTARFDTIRLEPVGPERVRLHGVRGEPPPPTLKVAMNELGGYRNDIAVALTGLDIEAKAELVQDAFWEACPYKPEDFASVTTRVVRTDKADPVTNEEAVAAWRLTVKDADERKVGRAVFNAMVELGLATIPGFFGLSGGSREARPYGVFRPALVPAELVPQHVVVMTTRERTVVDSAAPPAVGVTVDVEPAPEPETTPPGGPTVRAPLGHVVGARSGDKAGNANLGVFARTDEAWAWLDRFLTVDQLRRLLPETAELAVDRYRLANLRALNFVIHGLLQEGVAASTRQDGQAKSLGEWLRARVVDVPAVLLPDAS